MKALLRMMATALLVVISVNTTAQDYNTGIGIRFGGLTSGLTIKHFVNSNAALEGIVSFAPRSLHLTGLYEWHKPIANAKGLMWFYGVGGHVGFFSYGGHYYVYKHKGNNVYVEEQGARATVVGADFIIGLDYKFNNAPINLSLDLKPFINFWGGPYAYWDGALSARFVF
ncbi:MAG: hypothetical protein SH856_14205 [Flavobacteriales bacterium]|nr:hypothetical protein [Flavobacteriales bacterium]